MRKKIDIFSNDVRVIKKNIFKANFLPNFFFQIDQKKKIIIS